MRNVPFGLLMILAVSLACNGTAATTTPGADTVVDAPDATLTPETDATPAETNTPEPDLGNWKVGEEVNPLDDSRTVLLRLDADEKVKGWIGSSRPMLIIQCVQGETGAFFRLGTQASVEGIYQKHTIQLRIDADPATEVQAHEGSEGDTLFMPDGQAFAASLIGRETLVFGFTPFEASPATTTFQLAGLEEAFKPLREACGW